MKKTLRPRSNPLSLAWELCSYEGSHSSPPDEWLEASVPSPLGWTYFIEWEGEEKYSTFLALSSRAQDVFPLGAASFSSLAAAKACCRKHLRKTCLAAASLLSTP